MVFDDKDAFFMEKQRRKDEKVAKGKAVLELNISPLQDYCISPCNQNCESPPSIAFVLRLQPKHPTSFLFSLHQLPS